MTSITFSALATKLTDIAETAGAAFAQVGWIDDFDRDRTLTLPAVFIQPTQSVPTNATVTRSFEIYIFDELLIDESNKVAKWSSTEAIGLAMIANLKNNFDNLEFEFTTGTLEAVTYQWENMLHGWVFTFDIITPYEYNICE